MTRFFAVRARWKRSTFAIDHIFIQARLTLINPWVNRVVADTPYFCVSDRFIVFFYYITVTVKSHSVFLAFKGAILLATRYCAAFYLREGLNRRFNIKAYFLCGYSFAFTICDEMLQSNQRQSTDLSARTWLNAEQNIM